MEALATIRTERSDVTPRDGAHRLVEAFLSGKSARTLEAYGQDLEALADSLKESVPPEIALEQDKAWYKKPWVQ